MRQCMVYGVCESGPSPGVRLPHGSIPWLSGGLALCILAGMLLFGQSCRERPIALQHLGTPPAFHLKDQDGNIFHYKPASGHTMLLLFGYTGSPDFSPDALARIEKAVALLARRDRAMPGVIFVSIDSGRDTPEKLKAFLGKYAIKVIGLQGSAEEIEPVVRSFGAYSHVEEREGRRLVDHTTSIFLIDGQGELRHKFSTVDTAERIAAGIEAAGESSGK